MTDNLTPNKASRTSASGRPVMVLLELLGRKQTLRIVWELREKACTFRALQENCGGISPTVLNKRLAELRSAGIATHTENIGYQLSAEGHQLLEVLWPLQEWADRWAQRSS